MMVLIVCPAAKVWAVCLTQKKYSMNAADAIKAARCKKARISIQIKSRVHFEPALL
jgi:hypothetical protein